MCPHRSGGGPSWHLGVLPLDDPQYRGTAVSLVASHTVADGLGLVDAITDAVKGRTRDLGYPLPGSRKRGRAVLEDGRQTLASAPELGRALRAMVSLARRNRAELSSSIAAAPPPPRAARDDRATVVPTLSAYIDPAHWDARAKSLGGTSNSLLAGFASRLGVRTGRVLPDGTVTLSFPVGQRTADDTRGNAMTFAFITIDPAHAATDLGEIRGKLKERLTELVQNAFELLEPIPLASLTPKWLARKLVGAGLGSAGLPIGCSNLGDLDPAANRPDGTDADYAYGRLIEPGISKGTLERIGGQLFVVSGRFPGKFFVTVVGYRAGAENSQDELREMVSRTFDEFGLTAEIM
jgi:hypothetical protein